MALQEDRNRRRIAVVGAGTSGYLTVLYFLKNYDYNVEWIYPENSVTVGVGEATVPDVTHFFEDCGIDLNKFIRDMDGSLKLGIKFENFYEGNHYHPFGTTDEQSAELEHIMKNNLVPDNILEYTDISGHFDVGVLATYLDSIFKDYDNLTITRKTIDDFNLDYDWVIDCTGFTEKDVPLEIPNNAALVYRTKEPVNQYPYTTCRAMQYGWCWNIPLRYKTSIGYVHDDKYDVNEEFIQYIRDYFDVDPNPADIRKVKMITGRKSQHVDGKVISVGLASSFIEPLESTGLYLTVFGIRLVDKLIHSKITADEYNSIINNEFDLVTQFIIAHYKYSSNSNEYWDHYKTLDNTTYLENELFPKRSWNYILQENLPKLPVERMLKLRHGKKYSEWLNAKYS